MSSFSKRIYNLCKKKWKKKWKKALRPQFLVNMDKICMRKDFKYAQRPQAAFGRPKDPVAASGRLKILYDYISNNRKILLDTIWIMYSICDKQKCFFFKIPIHNVAYPKRGTCWYGSLYFHNWCSPVGNIATYMTTARKILETFVCRFSV